MNHDDEGTVAALVRTIREACERRDRSALLAALAPAVRATIDGGGWVAVPHPFMVGRDNVSDFLLELIARWPNIALLERSINGEPGILLATGPRVVGVVLVAIEDSVVDELWIILNPDKLSSWNKRAEE